MQAGILAQCPKAESFFNMSPHIAFFEKKKEEKDGTHWYYEDLGRRVSIIAFCLKLI